MKKMRAEVDKDRLTQKDRKYGRSLIMVSNEFHRLSPQDVFGALKTDISAGLEEAEVRKRFLESGANELKASARVSPWVLFFSQFKDILIQILLVAILLSAFMGHALESMGQPFLEMIIFGIALAVAVVPEALPAVVTISLAIGVQRMVKRHALIRRLPIVETLGCITVICSDKTGTLTKDEMTIRKIFVSGQIYDVDGSGYDPAGGFLFNGKRAEPSQSLIFLLRAATLASDAYLRKENDRWEIKGDPTEGALVVAAAKAGLDKTSLERENPRINEIPFSSESKRMTTLCAEGDEQVSYSKGADEVILNHCTLYQKDGKAERLDGHLRREFLNASSLMAKEALRVLAIAYKPNARIEDAGKDMVFLGLVGMIDPPRPEAKVAVQNCRNSWNILQKESGP
jgi:Ca2+-transporting ATPase